MFVAATHYVYNYPFDIELGAINVFVIAEFAIFDVLTHCDVRFVLVIHAEANCVFVIVLFTNLDPEIVLFAILAPVIDKSIILLVEIDKSANFVLLTQEFYNFVVETHKSANFDTSTLLLFKLFVFIARSAIYDDDDPSSSMRDRHGRFSSNPRSTS